MHHILQLSPAPLLLLPQMTFSLPETLIFKLIFFLLSFVSLSLLLCSLPPFFFYCIDVPWLFHPHEKGGSVLLVLLKVKALPGLHRARCRRLWSAQPSLYGIPSTPLAFSSLRCPTARPLPPLMPGCFLASLGLLVLPRL